ARECNNASARKERASRGDSPASHKRQPAPALTPGPNVTPGLANVARDKLRHLEHAHLTLAVEDRPESVVGVDHGSLFLILTTVFLDVVPKFFGELGPRQRSGANNGSEFVVGLHRSHEGRIRLAF